MTDSFYVVDVSDTHVVLGIQWLYSIGKYTRDYREMEMAFQGPHVGVRTLRIISFGNFTAVGKRSMGQNSLRGVRVSQNPFL